LFANDDFLLDFPTGDCQGEPQKGAKNSSGAKNGSRIAELYHILRSMYAAETEAESSSVKVKNEVESQSE
jgi:hypothetical protein